ncbi:YgjP-like metallopeptidase domain-containing protein [Alishewanella longhuensis]
MAIVVSETLPFNYELIFSPRRRSVQLAVVQGQLKVRAPTGTPTLFVHQLLLQKQAWVLKHLQATRTTLTPGWIDRTQILMGGELFNFSWQLAAKGEVILDERSLQVQVPVRVAVARRERYIAQLLQRYLTDKAKVFFKRKCSSKHC